jgi:hypothetical protein
MEKIRYTASAKVTGGLSLTRAVRTPDAFTQPLVIPKVVTYGMEHVAKKGSDTRQTVIWVLGAAAWYSIAPSAEYKPIFEQLVEKARVWLFLQDRYAKFHGKGRPLKGTVMEIYKDVSSPLPLHPVLMQLWRGN